MKIYWGIYWGKNGKKCKKYLKLNYIYAYKIVSLHGIRLRSNSISAWLEVPYKDGFKMFNNTAKSIMQSESMN